MNLIEKWMEARAKVKQAGEAEEIAYSDAVANMKPPLRKSLRPAEASDIVPDATIWYVYPGDSYWKQVQYVDHAPDQFKGYTAEDGCRYGLDHAYVEIQR